MVAVVGADSTNSCFCTLSNAPSKKARPAISVRSCKHGMNNHASFARKRSISSKRNLPSTKFLWHPAPALDSRTNPRWHLNPLDWMGNAGQREGFCSKCDVLFNHRQTLKLSIYERPSQRGLQKDPATDPAICCTFSRGHNQSLSTAGGQMPLSRSTTPMWPGLPLCCY